MTAPRNLNEHLAREADTFFRRGGAELELGQVLDRAGEIRRGRRMRATLLMAACVLAIAVPTLVIASGRVDHSPTPAHRTDADSAPLTVEGLRTGDQPRTGWVQGNVWHGSNGHDFTWTQGQSEDRVTDVAVVGRTTLVVVAGADGQRTVRLVPTAGDTTQTVTTWPMQGRLAVSADHDAAAFVKPDGTPVLVRESDQRSLTRVPGRGALTAAAVSGLDCTRPNPSGCTIWMNSQGPQQKVWVAEAVGTTKKFDTDMQSVADVSGDNRMAGVTSASDAGSCSELDVIGDGTRWKTCDHSLLSFSPDGQHLLATAPYRDGFGDSELTVLGTATGKPALSLRTAGQAAITQMVWEDDSHVLATVFDGGRWAVLRVGLDGHREYAVRPVDGPDMESPFVLPTR